MASAQMMVMSDKHQKELVQQMLEKARSIGMAANQSQGSAVVSMSNDTNAMVKFNQNHDYNGQVTGSGYPPAIASKSSAPFIHQGAANDGSSGAVVYYGINNSGASCGWLLAWSAPTYPSDSSPNKVYVECGPSSKYGTAIDWSKYKAKLDASDDTSNYTDAVTLTNISAQISSSGSFASVASTFGLAN